MPSELYTAAHDETAPLLTVAVPTYNRARFLREFLQVAGPQLLALQAEAPGDVEFLCADNASGDETATILDEAEQTGLRMRRFRHAENIGSDRNFLFCFRQARGRYFWLCGDDDVLRPGSIATVLQHIRQTDYDWIFLPPEPFFDDWQKEFVPDPYARGAEVVRSARQMALRVNVMVTFISGNVVNRERLLQVATEQPEDFVGTNLTQLSWTLPLLRQHRQSLILWQRLVAGRRMNSGGYSVGAVFGERFVQAAGRLLPGQPDLAAIFTNLALRQWFPPTLLELRDRDRGDRTQLHEADRVLRKTFQSNYRFWLFAAPVIWLPLPMARAWWAVAQVLNRFVRVLHAPGDVVRKLRSRLRFNRASH